jgi:hypothetical protein
MKLLIVLSLLIGTEIFAAGGGHSTKEHSFVEVTPTVSSGSAYTAGDQVGGIQTLTNAIWDSDGMANLNSVVILDKDSQAGSYVIYLFDELPTVVSVDNGAIDVSDAELADKLVSVITVATYTPLANSTVVSYLNANAAVRTVDKTADKRSNTGKLYAVVKTLGTPTYTSTSALVFKYYFEQ